VSDARRSAVNRSPAFERFVISGFPINQFRKDTNERFDIEAEGRLVLEPDVNRALSWQRTGEFHKFNCLPSDLWESENTLSLRHSHDAPLVCVVVRSASVVTHWRAPCWVLSQRETGCNEKTPNRKIFTRQKVIG